MERTSGIVSLAFALVLPLVAHAAPAAKARATGPAIDRRADLLPSASALKLSRSQTAAATLADPTVEDVGDLDSFGRHPPRFGVTTAFITLAPSCTPTPGEQCQVLNPSPATTSFNFEDTVHISLPAKATHSLLCYWFSPLLTVTYQNATAAPVVARLNYSPTLTVENPVLADPALIDPTTGVAFGGRLQTSMTSSESFQVPLSPGVQITERTRDSAVCIAGFLTRRALVDTYGLTDAQVTEFFKKPTTVRLNVRGSSQHVSGASLIFGLRIVGD